MAEISGYVKGPYEGVSEVPPQVRQAGACDLMEDCLPALPNGVQKRPPWELQAQLKRADTTAIPIDGQCLFVDIPRGDPALDMTLMIGRELVTGETPYLFMTADWSPVPLSITADAQAYLNLNEPVPHWDYRVCSVEDTTFIANRLVPTAIGSSAAGTRPYEAVIWCKTHGYARKTVVTVTPSGGSPYTASFTSGTGSNSNDPQTVGTDKLAKALYDGTDPYVGNDTPNPNPLNAMSGFTVILDGSLIYLSSTTDFTVQVSDDVGGSGVIGIKGTVQRFSDLPSVASDGFTVRVAQEAIGGNSDYYVQFVAGNTTNTGTWKEVIAPGEALGLDPLTMPVGLVEDATPGTWIIKVLDWKQRLTGTEVLSPDPEFVGSTINSIGWWRGRLALISDGQVNLSASDDPLKFYTTTLITAVDSDPIGLLAPTDLKTFFKEAVFFDQRFLVLGNRGQAIVSTLASKGAVTPTNTAIEPLAKHDFTDFIAPQSANHKVYYGATSGSVLSISELAIDRISGQALPEDLTAGVPTLLPSTIDWAATLEKDYLTLYGSSSLSTMYLHLFRHAEQQRVQNSWSVWNLPPTYGLCGIYMKGPVAYALIADGDDNGWACVMNLAQGVKDPDPAARLLTYADLRVSDEDLAPGVYSAIAHTTTFTLPYPLTSTTMYGASVRAPATGPYPEGYAAPVASVAGHTLVLTGDWTDIPLYFGFRYASQFTPTEIFKMGQDGSPEHSGRLTIQRVKADLSTFSYVRCTVEIKGRAARDVLYNGYNSDDAASLIDQPSNQHRTIAMSVPVSGKSDEAKLTFINDTFLGFKFLGFEWEGVWNPKAQRVT